MTPLEERFHQLKADIELLKIPHDEKKQFMIKKREMHKLADEFDTSPKNSKLKHNAQKEHVLASLDFLRASNDIVKKISEKTSLEFEDDINKLEARYTKWNNSGKILLDKFYEHSKKLENLESKGIENIPRSEVLSITKEAKDNIKKIKEQNVIGDEISKELQILSSKISIMVDGFESLINFLDGERTYP